MKTIKIAVDFSDTPGGRHYSDGPFTGEEFREKCIEPIFDNLEKGEKLLIDFDGAYGYPTSFLEEAFGGLARKYSVKEVLEKLKFISDDEPNIINEVMEYIQNEK